MSGLELDVSDIRMNGICVFWEFCWKLLMFFEDEFSMMDIENSLVEN